MGNTKYKSASNSASDSRKLLLIAASAAILAAAVVFSLELRHAVVAPTSEPYTQVATKQDTINNQMLTQFAKLCHGNYNQLDAQDQAQVNQITHGHGAIMMQMMNK